MFVILKPNARAKYFERSIHVKGDRTLKLKILWICKVWLVFFERVSILYSQNYKFVLVWFEKIYLDRPMINDSTSKQNILTRTLLLACDR